jgi:hypothetical protein
MTAFEVPFSVLQVYWSCFPAAMRATYLLRNTFHHFLSQLHRHNQTFSPIESTSSSLSFQLSFGFLEFPAQRVTAKVYPSTNS